MADSNKVNGFTNYATWSVSCFVSNDPFLNERASLIGTADDFQEFIEEYLENHDNWDGGSDYNLVNTLIAASLNVVDWQDLVKTHRDDDLYAKSLEKSDSEVCVYRLVDHFGENFQQLIDSAEFHDEKFGIIEFYNDLEDIVNEYDIDDSSQLSELDQLQPLQGETLEQWIERLEKSEVIYQTSITFI